jgi:hypothetical protein
MAKKKTRAKPRKNRRKKSATTTMIKVAYCKRCGRILTGERSVREGVGPGCKEKSLYQQRLEDQGQLRLFPRT